MIVINADERISDIKVPDSHTYILDCFILLASLFLEFPLTVNIKVTVTFLGQTGLD